MASLTLPPDLGPKLSSAFHWYPEDPAVREFGELVEQGAPWAPDRPRELLRIAQRHAVAVEGVRHVIMLLTGFTAPGRPRRMQRAIRKLRQAIADVESGKEVGLIYADDRPLLVFDDGPPRRSFRPEDVLPNPVQQWQGPLPVFADPPVSSRPMPPAPAPAPSPAPISPAPAGGSRPLYGGWVTRGGQ